MENAMNGFDDFDTQVTAEEFYDGWTEDEAEYQSPVQPSGDAVYEMSWDDIAAQWDDDPNPYAGTYSEE
jgi:hypothetical protein